MSAAMTLKGIGSVDAAVFVAAKSRVTYFVC